MSQRRPFWYLRRRPENIADDVDEELRHHFAMRVEELKTRGIPEEAARQEALRRFGDVEATRRYCRAQDEEKATGMQRTLMLQDFGQDVRVCLRNVSRAPVLTLTILLTVGLGIGATTAIFAALNAALLRPLPYASPDRLVRIYTDAPPFKFRLSAADYLAVQEQQTQFERIAYYTDRLMTFSDGQSAELLRGREVSPTYFGVLGIVPAAGRDFGDQDGRPGGAPASIVSYGFWLRQLGGRADAIGQPIRLDGAEYTVVGVLPRQVGPLEREQQFFIAAQLAPPPRKGPFLYTVVARLKRGVDLHTAASELHAINHGMFALWKTSYQDDKATWNMTDLEQFVVGDVKAVAGLALASVALVWLIACWNASNLLVARVTSRRRELAVRVALGASRGRVVRHLLAESALLAAGSLSIGLGIAWACIQLWRGVGADYFPRMQEASMDGRVALLLVALALTSGLIFGLVPALSGTGGPVVESLRSLSRSSTGSVAVRRLRLALVGTQFAVATPLLVGAGLLLASLTNCGRSTLASILATCSRGRSACRRRSTQRLPAPPRSGRRSSVVSGPFRESRSAPSPTAGHPMAPVTSTTSISRTRQRSRASRSRRRRGWLSRPAISTSSA